MRYRVTVEDGGREVEVTFAPSGAAVVRIDGRDLDCEVRPVPGGLSLRLGGAVHDVLVAGAAGDEMQLASGAARAIARVESDADRQRQAKKGGSAGGGQRELKAPMPGRIVKVLVRVGDVVAAHQPLIVIEAMKMENELRASGAATIAEVCVAEGASVESKAVLLRFS